MKCGISREFFNSGHIRTLIEYVADTMIKKYSYYPPNITLIPGRTLSII